MLKSVPTSLRRWLVVAVGVGVIAVAAFVAGVGKSAPVSDAVDAVGSTYERPFHGSEVDLVTDAPSVDLATAFTKIGGPVTLPSTSSAGEISKVVVDETASDEEGNPGLLIQYASGIVLTVSPGETDLDAAASAEFAPFKDGRKRAADVVVENGRRIFVLQGGIQTARAGSEARVPSRVMWNQDGYTYSAIAESDTVTTGSLIRVMNSVR